MFNVWNGNPFARGMIALVTGLTLCLGTGVGAVAVSAEEVTPAALEVSAEAALLMETSTGSAIFEKNADVSLPPASITKIMTLLLIFEAMERGELALDEVVTVSDHAAGMGGSQVFLEPMEQQTVETMIKCIAVASANDACVAMAEHLCGSEEAFVARMNERAKQLGMKSAHFVNCCGLDADGHLLSARDVAIMSRELITKHPEIHDYCQIWMENITHVTRKGTSEFGLTNTNKLIRQYPYATGLKTGSTGKAKFCVSATASKDGVELIAVVMAAADYKERFRDATKMLDYGFANCKVYRDEEMPELKPISVQGSLEGSLEVAYEKEFSYVSVKGEALDGIEKKLNLPDGKAPVKKGDQVGTLEYYLGEEKLGEVRILAKESRKKADYGAYLKLFMLELAKLDSL